MLVPLVFMLNCSKRIPLHSEPWVNFGSRAQAKIGQLAKIENQQVPIHKRFDPAVLDHRSNPLVFLLSPGPWRIWFVHWWPTANFIYCSKTAIFYIPKPRFWTTVHHRRVVFKSGGTGEFSENWWTWIVGFGLWGFSLHFRTFQTGRVIKIIGNPACVTKGELQYVIRIQMFNTKSAIMCQQGTSVLVFFFFLVSASFNNKLLRLPYKWVSRFWKMFGIEIDNNQEETNYAET